MSELAKATNAKIRSWTKETAHEITAEKSRLAIKHSEGSSWSNIKTGFRGGRNDLINRISFKAPRHAALLVYGVGKGRARGSGKETPKDWTTPIDKNFEKLADTITDATGDVIMAKMNFRNG